MPAVLLLILQQTLLLGIGLIGGTLKEKGINNYLIKIGSKFWGAMAIAVGKSMAYFSIYAINVLYTLVVIFRIFRIPQRGDYYDIFVFITPFIFAVIFMGITISTFFKKREHALMVLVFTSIPFIFLSGFSWPVESMPQWQVLLSYIIPSTHAIKGLVAITQKGSLFADVFQYWIYIWGVLIFYLITSSLLLMKHNKKELNNWLDKVTS
jgi:ABC-2 type transport system permease protein